MGQAEENKEVRQDERPLADDKLKQDKQPLTENELGQIAGGVMSIKNYRNPFDDL